MTVIVAQLYELPKFFYRELEAPFSNNGIGSDRAGRAYTGRILTDFCSSDRLSLINTTPQRLSKLLGEPYGIKRLRELGDLHLFMSGLFPERVDVRQYVEIGGTCYDYVASAMPRRGARRLFTRLSSNFEQYTKALTEMKENMGCFNTMLVKKPATQQPQPSPFLV